MSNQNAPADMSQEEVGFFHRKIADLWNHIQGLPLPVQQKLALQSESETSQDIGDMIANADQMINDAIKNLPDDATMSDKEKQLQALRVTVPYHYTMGQKDETWLNDQINSIISPNVSTIKPNNPQAPQLEDGKTPPQQI